MHRAGRGTALHRPLGQQGVGAGQPAEGEGGEARMTVVFRIASPVARPGQCR